MSFEMRVACLTRFLSDTVRRIQFPMLESQSGMSSLLLMPVLVSIHSRFYSWASADNR